jgi:hypothetical protein
MFFLELDCSAKPASRIVESCRSELNKARREAGGCITLWLTTQTFRDPLTDYNGASFTNSTVYNFVIFESCERRGKILVLAATGPFVT